MVINLHKHWILRSWCIECKEGRAQCQQCILGNVVISLLCLWPYGNSLIVCRHSEFYQCHTQNRRSHQASTRACCMGSLLHPCRAGQNTWKAAFQSRNLFPTFCPCLFPFTDLIGWLREFSQLCERGLNKGERKGRIWNAWLENSLKHQNVSLTTQKTIMLYLCVPTKT